MIAVATEGDETISAYTPTTCSRPAPATGCWQPLLAVIPAAAARLLHRRSGAGSTSISRATWPRPSRSSERTPDRSGERVAGVGIDLLEIERLERALERHPRLAQRLFTDGERAYAAARARPGKHLAARFCAKEAVAKALG